MNSASFCPQLIRRRYLSTWIPPECHAFYYEGEKHKSPWNPRKPADRDVKQRSEICSLVFNWPERRTFLLVAAVIGVLFFVLDEQKETSRPNVLFCKLVSGLLPSRLQRYTFPSVPLATLRDGFEQPFLTHIKEPEGIGSLLENKWGKGESASEIFLFLLSTSLFGFLYLPFVSIGVSPCEQAAIVVCLKIVSFPVLVLPTLWQWCHCRSLKRNVKLSKHCERIRPRSHKTQSTLQTRARKLSNTL